MNDELLQEYVNLCLLGSLFSVCILTKEERERLSELYKLVH